MELSFFFYKLVKSALVPPGLFVSIALFLSVLAFRKPRKPFLGFCLLVFATILWVLAAPLGVRLILAPLEESFKPSLPEAGNPVVMVLGGGSRYGEGHEDVEPKPYSLQRVMGAFSLSKTHEWPILLTGTRPADPDYISEARAMAKTLREMCFKGTILLEEESRTTWENFEKSAELIDIYGFDAVIVVTNAFHMKRSIWCATQNLPNVGIYPWPVGKLSDKRTLDALDFLPDSLHETILGLREYIGLAAYYFLHGN